jgi:hypothetical protein
MRANADSVMRDALRGPPPRPPEARLITDTVRLVQDYQRLRDRPRRTRSSRWLWVYGAASALACVWILWSGPRLTWTPHGLSAVAEWWVPIGCAALPWFARNIVAWMMGCVRLLQSSSYANPTEKETDP